MNSQGLDPYARKRIEKSLRLMLSYLDGLTGRMHQKMFPKDDPLKAAGEAAREKVQALRPWLTPDVIGKPFRDLVCSLTILIPLSPLRAHEGERH